MVDVFLVVAIAVAFAVFAVAGIYFIVYFQHPDDKNEAWIPKLVVLMGLMIAGGTVVGLALDATNNENSPGCMLGYDTRSCGGLDMYLYWQVMFMWILVWLVFFIPFSIFYYEEDDGTLLGKEPTSPACIALKYEMVVIFIVAVIFTLCYLFLSTTYIPVMQYNGTPNPDTSAILFSLPQTGTFSINQFENLTSQEISYSEKIKGKQGDVPLRLSAPVFFIGLMVFIGWFFFAIFGGIGLPALPMDFILAFKYRPRHMDAVEFAEAQLTIRERVNALVDVGELLKIQQEERDQATGNAAKGGIMSMFSRGGNDGTMTRQERREYEKTIKEFKKAVYLLEKDADELREAGDSSNEYNPLIPWMKLILGALSSILTILWILQICLYILPSNPALGFLNSYLEFWRVFPLFSFLTIAIFNIYALFCAIKGCFKFGLRFMWFTLYPMEYNKTYMSAFLFNTGLILLCVPPVVQLSVEAFGEYASNTAASLMFLTQLKYLEFFRYFYEYHIFIYAFLIISLLTTIYLALRPRENPSSALELRDRLKMS